MMGVTDMQTTFENIDPLLQRPFTWAEVYLLRYLHKQPNYILDIMDSPPYWPTGLSLYVFKPLIQADYVEDIYNNCDYLYHLTSKGMHLNIFCPDRRQ